MINNKNNAGIEVVKKIISVSCLLVAVGGFVLSLGFEAAFGLRGGGEFDKGGDEMPSLRTGTEAELTKEEQDYIEDAAIFTRKSGFGKVSGEADIESESSKVASLEEVRADEKEEINTVLEVKGDSGGTALGKPETAPMVSRARIASERNEVRVVTAKTKDFGRDRSAAAAEGVESAWIALKNGEFDKVLKIYSIVPPSREMQYLRAKAMFGQFKKGQADGRDVIEAWILVKSKNDLDTKWYNEADSVLNLFKR